MVAIGITIPENQVAGFCRRNRIRRLALFGSVLRQDFRPDSDVDVLVDFAHGQTPGLRLIDMQDELSDLFGGRKVDLVTEKFLNHRLRQPVLESAVVLYEE